MSTIPVSNSTVSLAGSLILEREGSFSIGGIKVAVKRLDKVEGLNFPKTPPKLNIFLKLFLTSLKYCIDNKVVKIALQIPFDTFVHEMGHALACKLLIQDSPEIIMDPKGFNGACPYHRHGIHHWKIIDSAIYAAGPLASTAFADCRLIAATALKNIIPKPLLYLLILGAVVQICNELLYASVSFSYKTDGDWGFIAKNDKTHLFVPSLLLGLQSALGLFLAIRLL